MTAFVGLLTIGVGIGQLVDAYAHGYRGAFTCLLTLPDGHLFLGVVALGFIARDLHSLALARWAGELVGPSRSNNHTLKAPRQSDN